MILSGKKSEKKSDLKILADELRNSEKKMIILYGHNGTGKTRLSTCFKDLGKQSEDDDIKQDTLYFNAFTEDLFYWDNDLEYDTDRKLKFNKNSRFFAGILGRDMEKPIYELLQRYANFDFSIDMEEAAIYFSRDVIVGEKSQKIENIKVSRGEENIFIWCFFLVILQLALDGEEDYQWVKYIYIDDPISSLDEHNAIVAGCHLAEILKKQDKYKVRLSTHHALFFNVLSNEFSRADKYEFSKNSTDDSYILSELGKNPFFYHIHALTELCNAIKEDQLFTYHFNILRTVLEKTANFHGYEKFSDCIKQEQNTDEIWYPRMINILSHGNYSLYEPRQMNQENKEHFKKILEDFLESYHFSIGASE